MQNDNEDGTLLLSPTYTKPIYAIGFVGRMRSRRRLGVPFIALLALSVVILGFLFVPTSNSQFDESEFPHHDPLETTLHFLLPADHASINLCKTLWGGYLLDYPKPTILGWGADFNTSGELAGGSHIAKIGGVLDYLKGLPSENDNDLVLMLDAYDIWIQFRLETLLKRYDRLLRESNENLRDRLGAAYDTRRLRQTVLFGAGKRCAPNELHTVACYPVPDSPLSMDLYGANTDTVIGRNKVYSLRQRYLNSGYLFGPVADVRKIFEHAWKRAQDMPKHDPEDNGSGDSYLMYHGSDQSIFSTMFGEQEYMREVMRRESITWWTRLLHPISSRTRRTSVMEGTKIDDIINPSFVHEEWSLPSTEKDNYLAREFGIFLDYKSDIGHQTVNSETDARWLTYAEQPLDAQVKGRSRFDCNMSLPSSLPTDVLDSSAPFRDITFPNESSFSTKSWNEVPLYTHLCLGTVPVFIHHNGDKGKRERNWKDMWYQGRSLEMFEADVSKTIGAWSSSKEHIAWEELCPNEWYKALFKSGVKSQHGEKIKINAAR